MIAPSAAIRHDVIPMTKKWTQSSAEKGKSKRVNEGLQIE